METIGPLVNKWERRGHYYSKYSDSRRLLGLCPFHSEKTPSFAVYENKDKFYRLTDYRYPEVFCCYGCHASGTAMDFLIQEKERGDPKAIMKKILMLGRVEIIDSTELEMKKILKSIENWRSH